jgi:nicotinate-nucleotide adenylyltransferase
MPKSNILAVYGGSFDPPHLGHELVIQTLFMGGYKNILIVPAGRNAMKTFQTKDFHRRAMMDLFMDKMKSQYPSLEIEINYSQLENTERISTTIELFEELKAQYKNRDIRFVVGSDLVDEIPTWYRFNDIMNQLKFLVIQRGEFFDSTNLLHNMELVSYKGFKPITLSSSMIRNEPKKMLESNYLNDQIKNYININYLYSNT